MALENRATDRATRHSRRPATPSALVRLSVCQSLSLSHSLSFSFYLSFCMPVSISISARFLSICLSTRLYVWLFISQVGPHILCLNRCGLYPFQAFSWLHVCISNSVYQSVLVSLLLQVHACLSQPAYFSVCLFLSACMSVCLSVCFFLPVSCQVCRAGQICLKLFIVYVNFCL